MSQKFQKCPTCDQYGYFGEGIMTQHKCKQAWNVWPDRGADATATERWRVVHADDAEGAACRAGSIWSDDEPFEGVVHVRQWNGSEDEQGPTATFDLTPRFELYFETVQK